jgi:DNA-binding MarR family transcriptional regulator
MSSSSAASAGSAVRLKRLGQMRDSTDRDLIILNAIGVNERLTQRHLAGELGVAVSLANLYLRRLALKGFIRIINVRPNRLRYLLTPKGIAEKTHLTYTHMARTFERYREARKSLREALRPLSEDGHKRIAFYGTGEAAEVAYLCLKETGLDLSAVFDAARGEWFLGLPVRGLEELVPEDFDRIVVTFFDSQEVTEAKVQELLRLGVSRDQIVTLQR